MGLYRSDFLTDDGEAIALEVFNLISYTGSSTDKEVLEKLELTYFLLSSSTHASFFRGITPSGTSIRWTPQGWQ